jgi:MoaA/NifB/PqqE/SkfB family radical SAM enzyme
MNIKRRIDIASASARVFSRLLYVKAIKRVEPIFMYLHLTNKCNLRCKYCYANVDDRFDDKDIKDIPTEEWLKLIDDSYRLGARYFHLYGGEPLLRIDIDKIIYHCLNKKTMVEILTNGHLVPNKIKLIRKIHSVCISLDGDREHNDSVRGKGNYLAVENAVRVCNDNDVPVRLHSTINRFNLDDVDFLPRIAKEWGTSISYSIPHTSTHKKIDQETTVITQADKQTFLKKIVELKKKRFPIDNTFDALNTVINWPYKKQELSEAELTNSISNPTRCVFGRYAVIVDSEGSVIKCINLDMREGQKFQEVGFEAAYKNIPASPCEYCSYLQFVETRNAVNMTPSSIIKGIKHHF